MAAEENRQEEAMFDRLDDILIHYEEVMQELNEPNVTENQTRFRKLMKEQADLAPIVEAYKAYKQAKQDIEDSLALLEEESDEEMRELAKEELSDAKKRVEELEQELKILLLPKDPNDDKNIILEIRAGAGGDEAALFAAELYRMYVNYAESQRWKVEIISLNESGIGGFKEVQAMVTGKGAYSKLKYESGVHRVQRVPETESGGRIHTSTATVAVMPEAEEVAPYLEVKVLLEEPEPMLRQEIEEVLTDKNYRLARIVSTYHTDAGKMEKDNEDWKKGLQEMSPLQIAQSAFERIYQVEMPAELTGLFQEAYLAATRKEEEEEG